MGHEVDRQLRQLLTEMGYAPDQLAPAARFAEELRLGWLGQLRLVEHLERCFGVDARDADLHAVRTLRDLAASVARPRARRS